MSFQTVYFERLCLFSGSVYRSPDCRNNTKLPYYSLYWFLLDIHWSIVITEFCQDLGVFHVFSYQPTPAMKMTKPWKWPSHENDQAMTITKPWIHHPLAQFWWKHAGFLGKRVSSGSLDSIGDFQRFFQGDFSPFLDRWVHPQWLPMVGIESPTSHPWDEFGIFTYMKIHKNQPFM